MRKTLLLATAGVLLLECTGCSYAGFLAAILAPEASKKKVMPEFDGLPGKTVAVVVYAGPDIQVDYLAAQRDTSAIVSNQLGANIKGLKTVNPDVILRYQDENPGWDTAPPGAMCKPLRCDYVLMISLQEYSVREPGMVALMRGKIVAQAVLHKPEPESYDKPSPPPAWRAERLEVIFPPDKPEGVPTENEYAIRMGTVQVFADTLAKKFYKHEIKEKPR